MPDILPKQQREILHHTLWRAANRIYCGNDADIDLSALVRAGLMRYVGSPGFLPQGDSYYTITGKGREALREDEKARGMVAAINYDARLVY